MAVSALILNSKKDWVNPRVNNLTVDGTLSGSGALVEKGTFQLNLRDDGSFDSPAINFYYVKIGDRVTLTMEGLTYNIQTPGNLNSVENVPEAIRPTGFFELGNIYIEQSSAGVECSVYMGAGPGGLGYIYIDAINGTLNNVSSTFFNYSWTYTLN